LLLASSQPSLVRQVSESLAGRGYKTGTARAAEQIADDVGASLVWILDQAAGTEALRPSVWRRSFAESQKWLPE
jgi:hypothetical protein